jgi:hypothetical protein
MDPRAARARRASTAGAFEELQASVLHCNQCRGPQPVHERLLLVLPDGELYEYLCVSCGASLGKRKISGVPPGLIGA